MNCARYTVPFSFPLRGPVNRGLTAFFFTCYKKRLVGSLLLQTERFNFRFKGIEYDPPLGLFVTTINGLEANSTKKEYWHILGKPEGNNDGWNSLPLGVSNYQLNVTGQKILFRMDTWSDDSHDEAHGNQG